MMKFHLKLCVGATVVAALLVSFQSASAGTIIKLSLGDDPMADVEYMGGVLSTVDDTNGTTSGDQNTAVDFLGFLSGETDIVLSDASYSLNGVTAFGPASLLFGILVAQNFSGGTFQLWDDSDSLLLDVVLGDSALVGPVGGPATGAVFSTTFSTPTGNGSLDSQILPGTVSMSISMTNINNGAGLSFTPIALPTGTLNPFTADITKTIAAEQVPEPATGLMLVLAALASPALLRRRS